MHCVLPPHEQPLKLPMSHPRDLLLFHHSSMGVAPGILLEDCGDDPGDTGEPPKSPHPELSPLDSLEQQPLMQPLTPTSYSSL